MDTNLTTLFNNNINERKAMYAKSFFLIILFSSGLKPLYGHFTQSSMDAMVAVQKIDDKATLYEIIKNDTNQDMRIYAAVKFDDQSLLEAIATNTNEEFSVRHFIIQYLSSQRVLADIALHDNDRELRNIAVFHLVDLAVLDEIEKDTNQYHLVRFQAGQSAKYMREIYEDPDELSSFFAFKKTNETEQVSEAALDYLRHHGLITMVDANGQQTTNNNVIFTAKNNIENDNINSNETTSILLNVKNKENVTIKKLFIIGMGSLFILLLFVWRVRKNNPIIPSNKKNLL